MNTVDNRSDMQRAFERVATKCTLNLVKISEEGRVVLPSDIQEAQAEIVAAIGKVFFMGIDE